MLRKNGFFILLVILIASALIIANANIKTDTITASSFYDHVVNAVTDEQGNIWVLYRDNEGYTVIQYTPDGKIGKVTGLQSKGKDTGVLSEHMYVDKDQSLFVTKSYLDNTTGLVESETVVIIKEDSVEEVFRIEYKPEDNVWLPTISHIVCEGNNLFVVMNEISSIKVYAVSLASKEASKTDEYIPTGDVYIDSAVRLDNGTVVFSTKEGNVFVIRNKKEAEKIYPQNKSTAQIGKLHAVTGNEVRFLDYTADIYGSMSYMDFPLETVYKDDDVLLEEPQILFNDIENLYTGSKGHIVSVMKYKGDTVMLYGSAGNLKMFNVSQTAGKVKTVNTLMKVLFVLAALCLTIVIWQIFLYFDIKYFRKKRIVVRTVPKSNSDN
ncbi:MAG TPA: hypothetical protein DDZ89_02160 [Clostridiales bacterium]|nr:hypothetical protein [Clostridiales bacterium]